MIRRELHLDMRQLAWLAGLLEGEGTFVKGSPAKPRRPVTAIGMVDRDIIERVCDLWGTRLYTHIPKVERYKQVYHIAVYGDAARAIMGDIAPLMGARRGERIAALAGEYGQLRLLSEARACYDVRRAA